MPMNDGRGFSLVEVMVAMAILAIGILGVMMMQAQATRANASSMGRTDANAVAASFVAELKRFATDCKHSSKALPAFIGDGGGAHTGIVGLDDGAARAGAAPTPGIADHGYKEITSANFPQFVNTYAIVNGQLVDNAGRSYQIFWNVAAKPWGGSDDPYRTVKIFLYWRVGTQLNHLEYVTEVEGI